MKGLHGQTKDLKFWAKGARAASHHPDQARQVGELLCFPAVRPAARVAVTALLCTERGVGLRGGHRGGG